MRLILTLTLAASPLWAETCPPVPDQGAQMDALLEQVRQAPDQITAQDLSNQLWALWATAPDSYAQDLLNTGMERRSAYDFDGAVTAFDALVAYCPHYAEGYNQRAFIAFLRQDYAPALIDLDRALDLSPRHVAALSGKALTLMGLNRNAEAQIVLRQALDLNPWIPERGLLQEPPGQDL